MQASALPQGQGAPPSWRGEANGMYYAYILLLSNGQLYAGSSADLRTRLQDHQRGRVVSTAHRRPLRLIHYEAYTLKEDAERRERFLKKSEGKKLLKQQLSALFKQLGIKQNDDSLRP